MPKNIIDQTSDPGYATLRVLVDRYPELMEISKTADVDADNFSKVASESFAWPEARKFPIWDRGQTALSIGYRKLATGVPAEVDALLTKAAEAYDIDLKIFSKPQEKVAQEEYWLLPDKKRYRIGRKEDIKIAERILREKYAQLTIPDRAEAFHRLGKVAEELGVSLAPSTYKLAGFTITSTQKLRDWLHARKEASIGTEISKAYEKIASMYVNVPPYIYDHYTQVKLASAIYELDQSAGLEHHYGKRLPDPIQTVFNTDRLLRDQVKVGQDFGVDKSTLAALPLSFWEDILGPEVAREIAPTGEVDPEALAQILPTLPDDLKAIIQTQLAGQ